MSKVSFIKFWPLVAQILDDGKRLRACEKRLELQSKTKSKREGGVGGNGRRGWFGILIPRHERPFLFFFPSFSPPFRLGLLDFSVSSSPPPRPPSSFLLLLFLPSSSSPSSSSQLSSALSYPHHHPHHRLLQPRTTTHYWRRREPPVCLRCPHFHSGFIAKGKKQVAI